MRKGIALASLLLAVTASAQLAPFDVPSAAALRGQQPIPLPSPRAGDVVTRPHMLAQAGREALFGYADTEAQFREAVEHWSDVLRAAGIAPSAPSYKDGFYLLPYATADGRVIRDFLADAQQFAPKDEAALRADMDLARLALRGSGLKPIASSVVSLEGLLPTYSILYLTKPAASPEGEIRLRRLKTGGSALDLGLLAVGARVVSAPKPWLAVYVGPEVGALSFGARDRAHAAEVLGARKAALASRGKRVFADAVYPHSSPAGQPQGDAAFAVLLYFYQ